MDLKELEGDIDQNKHWYYKSKLIPLEKFANSVINSSNEPVTIVDVGAGTGFFSESLKQKFQQNIKQVIQVDINYTDKEIAESQNTDIVKTKTIPKNLNNCLILLMDVLEHVENDSELLRKIHMCSEGSNSIFITTPAFMKLWSTHDEFLFHFRRYKLNNLTKLVSQNGFNIQNRFYIYISILPIVWFVRKLNNRKGEIKSDLKKHSLITNKVLYYIFKFENIFHKKNRLAGLTCCIEASC